MKTFSSFAILFLVLSLSACTENDPIKPFTTDICSCFPDRLYGTDMDWSHCCIAHDRAYWQGGSFEMRRQADRDFAMCMEEETGSVVLATAMYYGLYFSGTPYLPTSFRWGYGYDYGRGYREESKEGESTQ